MLTLGSLVIILSVVATGIAKPPHILVFVYDDLGWNDVSYHTAGTPKQAKTPNIDQLALEGVRLTHNYVAPVCSPTRTSFHSGRGIMSTGIYEPLLVTNTGTFNLSCNRPTTDRCNLISDSLQSLGYETHAIGKWHLGWASQSLWPTNRGYDSFHGYLLGEEDYWTKDRAGGYDFRRNLEVDWSGNGTYSAYQYTNYTQTLLEEYVKSGSTKPLFIYVAWQDIHAPREAPSDWIAKFPDTPEPRRTVNAMGAIADSGTGNITQTLKSLGLYDDFLILGFGDNGAAADGYDGNYGCSLPLCGRKFDMWDGGVRTPGFVMGKGVSSALVGKEYPGYFHVTDWYFTLLSAASEGTWTSPQNQPPFNPDFDGVDQWPFLSGQNTTAPPRTSIVHYARQGDSPLGVVLNGDWKLVAGSDSHITDQQWYQCPGINFTDPSYFTVNCGGLPPKTPTCNSKQSPCLFNITADPCEFHNVADQNQEIVNAMLADLARYQNLAAPDFSQGSPTPKKCLPNPQNNFTWTNCD